MVYVFTRIIPYWGIYVSSTDFIVPHVKPADISTGNGITGFNHNLGISCIVVLIRLIMF
jgi:hypothetical protein